MRAEHSRYSGRGGGMRRRMRVRVCVCVRIFQLVGRQNHPRRQNKVTVCYAPGRSCVHSRQFSGECGVVMSWPGTYLRTLSGMGLQRLKQSEPNTEKPRTGLRIPCSLKSDPHLLALPAIFLY